MSRSARLAPVLLASLLLSGPGFAQSGSFQSGPPAPKATATKAKGLSTAKFLPEALWLPQLLQVQTPKTSEGAAGPIDVLWTNRTGMAKVSNPGPVGCLSLYGGPQNACQMFAAGQVKKIGVVGQPHEACLTFAVGNLPEGSYTLMIVFTNLVHPVTGKTIPSHSLYREVEVRSADPFRIAGYASVASKGVVTLTFNKKPLQSTVTSNLLLDGAKGAVQLVEVKVIPPSGTKKTPSYVYSLLVAPPGPGASVVLSLDGALVRSEALGEPLDGDGDGVPGGVRIVKVANEAQNKGKSIDESWARSVGNEWAGASFESGFQAVPAGMNGGVAHTGAYARATGSLLKQEFTIFEAKFEANVPGTIEESAKLGPWTIAHETSYQPVNVKVSSSAKDKSETKIALPTIEKDLTIASFEYTLWIVSIEAGLGFSLDVSYSAAATPAGLSAKASVKGAPQAWVSAGLTVIVAGVDLKATIQLFAPTLTLDLFADLQGVEGKVDLCFEPIVILIQVHAWVGFSLFGATIELWSEDYPLVQWSEGKYCTTLLDF